ncbi:hypothetical protein F5878DRAFT_13227, partial [Lentinula raphanica]
VYKPRKRWSTLLCPLFTFSNSSVNIAAKTHSFHSLDPLYDIRSFNQLSMDYSQIIQQSLQAMLADNPQLILQFLQQTSPPASGSSGPPLTISPQPSAPGSSTPPSSSSESSSGSGSGSVALPVPPISQTVPVSAPALLPSTSTLTASLHSQPAPPITSYISPVHMLSSVHASGSSSGHSPLAPPASPFHSLTTIE